MSLNSAITAAASLQRLDGVAGVMLFKGRHTIHRQMPFSDTRAEELREIIGQMLEGYRQVRRKIRQIYLEFDGGVLLAVVQDESVMLFFLTSRADSDLAASAASVMLNDHASILSITSSEAQPVPRHADGIEDARRHQSARAFADHRKSRAHREPVGRGAEMRGRRAGEGHGQGAGLESH